jgi:hypothetical protein
MAEAGYLRHARSARDEPIPASPPGGDATGHVKHARGELRGLTGVDDPCEAPTDPDLRIDTDGRPVDAAVWTLLATVSARYPVAHPHQIRGDGAMLSP